MTPGARSHASTRQLAVIAIAWLAYVVLLWVLQAGIYPALPSDRARQIVGAVAGLLVAGACVLADRSVLDAYRAPRRHWAAAIVAVAAATAFVALTRQPPADALARGVAFYVVGAALPEETFIRGYLWQRVGEITRHPMAPTLTTAVLFGLMHVPRLVAQGEPLWIAGTLTLIGLALGLLRAWLGKLPLVAGVHVAVDLLG